MRVRVLTYGRLLRRRLVGGRRLRVGGEVAGAVRVDPQGDGVADAPVVDGGEDRVTGGEGEPVEAVQDGVLDLLARGRDHQ
ncbi:hypothetical protein STENM223S_09502 [Streptomyces tendae]